MPDNDPIEHVIVLTLENRSFDHMLGACHAFKSDIEGVSPEKTNTNKYLRKSFPQVAGAARLVIEDPRHETPHVLAQLQDDNGGFVKDYATAYPMLTEVGRHEVMKYHDLDTLPALHALARGFTVCDKWFSSVPGPTWTNRLFLMSGTSLGRVGMPNGIMDMNLHWYDQMTIFDRLNEKSKTWAVYYGDTPLSLLLVHQWEPRNKACHKPMTQFFKDVVDQQPPLPEFVFIEPAYLDPGANDDHPSHDVLAGEALIASVYNAIRANEDLWQKTLLVILFDEHGGFYDHVVPPEAIPPDHHQKEWTFDRLGVRVPAILVSPWVGNGVLHTQFDHTSLLKYLIDKWQLGPLGDRGANAQTFSDAFLDKPRIDTPDRIPAVPAGLKRQDPLPRKSLNDHENALVALSHALETMAEEDPTVIAARSRQIVSSPQSQIDVAVERVEAFLQHGASEAIRLAEGN